MTHKDPGYWDTVFGKTKSDTVEPEAPAETEKEETTDMRHTDIQQQPEQQQDVRAELLRELQESIRDTFSGFREEVAAMVRDMTAQPSTPAGTSKPLAKDKAAVREQQEQATRYDALMNTDVSKWRAEDREFVRVQTYQQLTEEQAAAAVDELPDDPEALRLYALEALKTLQQ